MQYAPESISVRFIGSARTEAGTRLNVFSTISREHISIYPLTPNGALKVQGIPVKLADLSPQVRRRLGC
jgi:hypothetical protein